LRAFSAGLGFPLSFDLATVEARPAMVAERARVSMRRAAYRGQSTRRGYTPMVFMLNGHPSRSHDLLTPDAIRTIPIRSITPYLDGVGNKCLGFWPRQANSAFSAAASFPIAA
jgi:hypothetical protein